MATRKPRTKNISKVDADKASVYVRISQEANAILEDAAYQASGTKAAVIEALLINLAQEEDPAIKMRILKGQNVGLKEQGDLLELRNWAEHAFLNKRYVWAAEMYRLLANHPKSSEGLRNISNYR